MPTSSGEEVSTGELKNVLKEIVDGEDKRKPYTDDELVELMNKKGYQIARRTIAKYRQLLDIPVARLKYESTCFCSIHAVSSFVVAFVRVVYHI